MIYPHFYCFSNSGVNCGADCFMYIRIPITGTYSNMLFTKKSEIGKVKKVH